MNFIQNSYIVNMVYIDMRGVNLETMKKTINLSLRPYDDSMWDRYSMYDNMPYVWDSDLNVEKIFNRVSGNLIIAYRCKIKEPYEIKHE